jgi:hypothetical protein
LWLSHRKVYMTKEQQKQAAIETMFVAGWNLMNARIMGGCTMPRPKNLRGERKVAYERGQNARRNYRGEEGLEAA